jgi:hypothetical protein
MVEVLKEKDDFALKGLLDQERSVLEAFPKALGI